MLDYGADANGLSDCGATPTGLGLGKTAMGDSSGMGLSDYSPVGVKTTGDGEGLGDGLGDGEGDTGTTTIGGEGEGDGDGEGTGEGTGLSGVLGPD